MEILSRKDGGKVTSRTSRPKVVILGVGFSGLWAARTLGALPVDVQVIDHHNYHTFFPLIYQVGAAELEPEDISYPVRHIFRKYPNVRFYMDDVENIDMEKRQVTTSHHIFPYDYLILGLGSRPFFYGIPGADEYAFPIKDLDQAIALRNHILYSFERAACTADPEDCKRLLTFAIVGGGPTGVEFAGALTELINGSLQRDFPSLDIKNVRVLLIEASDHLLAGFPKELGEYAAKRLGKKGVEVYLNSPVVEIQPHSLKLKDGTTFASNTVAWTAGVRGHPMALQWGLPTERNGQVAVLPTLQAPGHPEVYVVGDLARIQHDGQPLPMVAQVALQEGRTAAENILRQIRGQEQKPFRYHDRGMLAIIGRNSAAAWIWGRSFTGFIAWLIWLSVHITYLIGYRSRLFVLVDWAWDYFFGERGVRQIFPARLGIQEEQPVAILQEKEREPAQPAS